MSHQLKHKVEMQRLPGSTTNEMRLLNSQSWLVFSAQVKWLDLQPDKQFQSN